MSKKDKNKSKLSLGLKGTQNPSLLRFQKELTNQIELLPLLYQYHMTQGKLKKAEFDGLVKTGFTPEQALEIVKTK